MIVAGSKQNQPKFVKLNNGRIIKKIDEQYIREDLPCGLSTCPFCDKNYSNFFIFLKPLQLADWTCNWLPLTSRRTNAPQIPECAAAAVMTLTTKNALVQTRYL